MAGHPVHIDGLVQDCSNSNTLAVELLQSWTKPSTWSTWTISSFQTFQTTHLFDIKHPCIVEYRHEGLYELCLAHGLHTLAHNLHDTISGTLSQQQLWHEAHQQGHEALIGNEPDVDPGNVSTDHIQALASDFWVWFLISFLQRRVTVLYLVLLSTANGLLPSLPEPMLTNNHQ